MQLPRLWHALPGCPQQNVPSFSGHKTSDAYLKGDHRVDTAATSNTEVSSTQEVVCRRTLAAEQVAPLRDDALALAARHPQLGIHDRAAEHERAQGAADTGQAQRLVTRQLLQDGVQDAVREVQQRGPRPVLQSRES